MSMEDKIKELLDSSEGKIDIKLVQELLSAKIEEPEEENSKAERKKIKLSPLSFTKVQMFFVKAQIWVNEKKITRQEKKLTNFKEKVANSDLTEEDLNRISMKMARISTRVDILKEIRTRLSNVKSNAIKVKATMAENMSYNSEGIYGFINNPFPEVEKTVENVDPIRNRKSMNAQVEEMLNPIAATPEEADETDTKTYFSSSSRNVESEEIAPKPDITPSRYQTAIDKKRDESKRNTGSGTNSYNTNLDEYLYNINNNGNNYHLRQPDIIQDNADLPLFGVEKNVALRGERLEEHRNLDLSSSPVSRLPVDSLADLMKETKSTKESLVQLQREADLAKTAASQALIEKNQLEKERAAQEKEYKLLVEEAQKRAEEQRRMVLRRAEEERLAIEQNNALEQQIRRESEGIARENAARARQLEELRAFLQPEPSTTMENSNEMNAPIRR